MPSFQEYNKVGQSIWSDFLSRSFIKSGELQKLIDEGLRGVTANPTIFEKAIVGSVDYDDELKRLASRGASTRDLLESLMLDDIAMAADLFRPVYDSLDGADGFVSVEVNPEIADDSDAMTNEARRFFYRLNRPNVMIKIPATRAGIPAIRRLIAEGINVNITLLFSVSRYEQVVEAFLEGLEELATAEGGLEKVRNVSSVASFFVSRVDTIVDEELERKDEEGAKELRGRIAIANAKMAYQKFNQAFKGPRWSRLRDLGARIQRPLWASTSTKNPSYPDTMYVDSLVGNDTVNTMTPETIRAAMDHGRVRPDAVESGLDEAEAELKRLAALGIDLEGGISNRLEDEGIEKFSKSYETLLSSLERKKDRLTQSEPQGEPSPGKGVPAKNPRAIG